MRICADNSGVILVQCLGIVLSINFKPHGCIHASVNAKGEKIQWPANYNNLHALV